MKAPKTHKISVNMKSLRKNRNQNQIFKSNIQKYSKIRNQIFPSLRYVSNYSYVDHRKILGTTQDI